MGTQTVQGKGFEYACLQNFYGNLLSKGISCQIEENKAYFTAKKSYEGLPLEKQRKMMLAAQASFETIFRAEPNLAVGQEIIYLSLATDMLGSDGDVRDVILLKGETGWEIGISCKHNHHALKHSRLSNDIDFGKKWLNLPVSNQYFAEIKPIFAHLAKLRHMTKDLPKEEQYTWSMIENKEDTVYIPILNAFKKELLRLTGTNPNVPLRLINYLLGRKDFYKVIAKDKERKTIIQAFNLSDTLSQPYNHHKAQSKMKSLSGVLPTKIYHFDYKEGSKNTLELIMDNGWAISFRIHNASSRVEPSLKFDIQLIGIPQSVTNVEEYWED